VRGIVYFTSEQDARRFAQEPPAAADEPVLERLRSLMTNVRCFDLRDPQLLSPSDVPLLADLARSAPVTTLAAGWLRGHHGKVRGHDDRTSAACQQPRSSGLPRR
jgi:hypothetical protein